MVKKIPNVPLERRLSYRCSLISTRITRFLAPMWEKRYGLTVITWHVMAVIGRYGPLSAKDIAQHTSTDAFYVSRAVEQLTQRGFVQRDIDPHDRRRASLSLTVEGRKVHRKIEDSINRLEAEFLADLDEEGKRLLDAALDHLDQKTKDLQQSGKSWEDYA